MNNGQERGFFRDKKILVTGGAGTIGQELVKELLMHDPAAVRVLDNNESELFFLEERLSSTRIRILVGDVRDKERLRRAVEDVDIIFHAAALKHVPLCECNPFDAVKTNVLGTQNVIDCALDEEVEKMIFISTDKAVNPTNVMGATKLLAERLVISSNHYRGKRTTALACVRFGNVLDSRGSVIPLFRKQIELGGPVTVTDPGMTRFIMSIPDAVNLILNATRISRGGELFIFKMPAIHLIDLAKVMIRQLSIANEIDAKKVKIEIIGKRAGEKLFEELLTSDEAMQVVEKDGLMIVEPSNLRKSKKSAVIRKKQYTSENADKLTIRQIEELLRENHII